MPAPGWLMLVGTRTEILFYKDLLEKLGIRADFLQMGIFKFAAEPFIRTNMSKEAKAAVQPRPRRFLHQLLRRLDRPLAQGQEEHDPRRVTKIIDEGPFTAQEAPRSSA